MTLKQKCIIDTLTYILLTVILSFIAMKLELFPINFIRGFCVGTCSGVTLANIAWYFIKRNYQ